MQSESEISLIFIKNHLTTLFLNMIFWRSNKRTVDQLMFIVYYCYHCLRPCKKLLQDSVTRKPLNKEYNKRFKWGFKRGGSHQTTGNEMMMSQFLLYLFLEALCCPDFQKSRVHFVMPQCAVFIKWFLNSLVKLRPLYSKLVDRSIYFRSWWCHLDLFISFHN